MIRNGSAQALAPLPTSEGNDMQPAGQSDGKGRVVQPQATVDGRRSFHGYFLAVLAPARVERPFGVEATVGVGAKIVAQTLE